MQKKYFRDSRQILFSIFSIILLLWCNGDSFADDQDASGTVLKSSSVSGWVKKLFSQDMFSSRGESNQKIIISEVMSKNKTSFMDAAGDYPDWIEIENCTDNDINLRGWSLSDDPAELGWEFPDFMLYARSRAIIFASKKVTGAPGELHASFALSEGETVCLRNRNGRIVSLAEIINDKSDRSYIPDENGSCRESKYPTPGLENSLTSFAYLESLKENLGPVIINEVYVDGKPDWIEIKNISLNPVLLSDYFLSKDEDNLKVFNLPGYTLSPGELMIIDCTDKTEEYFGYRYLAPFSIDSNNDRLFLSDCSGKIIDSISLKDIPNGGSYGRENNKNGSFYFTVPSPGRENENGKRYLAKVPVSLRPDGIFNNVSSVTVELAAEGTIFYTTDGSRPNRESKKYSGPFEVNKTCTVRAFVWTGDAVESEVLTLNYIINEGHSLPVACLSSDSILDFNTTYYNQVKGYEIPGNIALYDENGKAFSVPCGIKLNGYSTLGLAKKNMSLSFDGKYGSGELICDLFRGGNIKFSNLLLRGGGDQLSTIVRNEACSNLCMNFTDKVVAQRSKYCVLYINGNYFGIYSLMEKANEALYASFTGVSKKSVSVNDATVEVNNKMYQDVLGHLLSEDTNMSLPENYKYVCEHLDIDSFIDWCIFEGWSGNNDLVSGNLRYASSSENDGKWTCMLYDLDAAFRSAENCMMNVTNFWNQVTLMNNQLFKNAEYKDKFLSRLSYALNNELTEDNFLAEMNRLYDQIDSEVQRDSHISGLDYESWKMNQKYLEDAVKNGWNLACTENICEILELSSEEQIRYFGEVITNIQEEY